MSLPSAPVSVLTALLPIKMLALALPVPLMALVPVSVRFSRLVESVQVTVD